MQYILLKNDKTTKMSESDRYPPVEEEGNEDEDGLTLCEDNFKE